MATLVERTHIKPALHRLIDAAERLDLRFRLWKSNRSIKKHGTINIRDL